MGRHSKVEPPARAQRDESAGSGYHRAVGPTPRRGVAKWPIACLVTVALLAVAWVGWMWGNNVLNSRAEAQANACSDGHSTLRVAVSPGIEEPVENAARKWNEADQVVHDQCITVEVTGADSRKVLESFDDRGTDASTPAVWIPESKWWTEQLAGNHPTRIAGNPVSIATARSADYPFIGITGHGVDGVQERAAQAFRHYLLEPEQRTLFTQAGFSA